MLTDDGIIGWGEAFAQGLEPPEIAAAVIDKALKPLVIGRRSARHRSAVAPHVPHDPRLRPQGLGDRRPSARWTSRCGTSPASSTACPIYKLLGGAFRTRVQPYATGFYRIKGQGEATRLAEEAMRHFEAGFSLMKVKLGYGVDDDIACMKAIGRAMQGKPVTLMVDTNHAYGRAEALRLGRALAEYDLRWYEEPVVPGGLQGYVEMRQQAADADRRRRERAHAVRLSRVPRRRLRRRRAAGHRFLRRHLTPAGTSSRWRSRTACRSIRTSGVRRSRRRRSLQFIAAVPVAHHSLFAAGAGPRVRPLLASVPPAADHAADAAGRMAGSRCPSGPGLGVEVDRAVLEKFRT